MEKIEFYIVNSKKEYLSNLHAVSKTKGYHTEEGGTLTLMGNSPQKNANVMKNSRPFFGYKDQTFLLTEGQYVITSYLEIRDFDIIEMSTSQNKSIFLIHDRKDNEINKMFVRDSDIKLWVELGIIKKAPEHIESAVEYSLI